MTPLIEQIKKGVKEKFVKNKTILSFQEYLEQLEEKPELFLRSSAQYLKDCITYFQDKTSENNKITKKFSLFDIPFDNNRDPLVNQTEAQIEFVRIINNFISSRRNNKLITLHGPNGSAKSRFVNCIFRAMEYYSGTEEGAIYTFNWIFPVKKISGKTIGFTGSGKKSIINS